jgi:hypothetical protein
MHLKRILTWLLSSFHVLMSIPPPLADRGRATGRSEWNLPCSWLVAAAGGRQKHSREGG